MNRMERAREDEVEGERVGEGGVGETKEVVPRRDRYEKRRFWQVLGARPGDNARNGWAAEEEEEEGGQLWERGAERGARNTESEQSGSTNLE